MDFFFLQLMLVTVSPLLTLSLVFFLTELSYLMSDCVTKRLKREKAASSLKKIVCYCLLSPELPLVTPKGMIQKLFFTLLPPSPIREYMKSPNVTYWVCVCLFSTKVVRWLVVTYLIPLAHNLICQQMFPGICFTEAFFNQSIHWCNIAWRCSCKVLDCIFIICQVSTFTNIKHNTTNLQVILFFLTKY